MHCHHHDNYDHHDQDTMVLDGSDHQPNHDHHHCRHWHHHSHDQETMVLDGSDRRRMEEFGKKHLLLLGSMDRHGQSHDDDDDDDGDDDDDDDLDGKSN